MITSRQHQYDIISFNMIFFLKAVISLLLVSIILKNTDAQETKSYTIQSLKGNLRCNENIITKHKIYSNAEHTHDDVIKEYESLAPDPTFVGFIMNSHDQFVKAFCKVFSKKRLEEISNNDESISVYFDLDQNGIPLSISFSLDSQTKVTPDEIINLDEIIRQLVTFTPIQKSNQRYFYVVRIKTTFKEVLEGEIPNIRKSENAMLKIAEIEKLKEEE